MEQQWIKCSPDNLPHKAVLCVNKRKDYLIGYVYQVANDTYHAENDNELLEKVIAWMALPEPPKD